jgi:hypothetical protein
MKIYIIIAVISSFYVLSPILTLGQAEDKKSAISYVAEMEKKEVLAKKKTDPSYVSSQKNNVISPKDSYVAKRNKENISAPKNNEPSYINSRKSDVVGSNDSYVGNHSTQVLVVSYIQTKKPKSSVTEVNAQRVHRVTMVSTPVEKIRPKVFSAEEIVVNSQTEFSFNQADYKIVKRWAEEQRKLHVVKRVLRKYGDAIKVLALEFGIDSRIIVAICAHESGGYPDVTSSAKAKGLMQLKPSTAATYGLPDSLIYDPQLNLRAGTRHFLAMLKLFGNVKDAIYAYGWGQGAARTGLDAGTKADELRGVQEVLYLIQIQ